MSSHSGTPPTAAREVIVLQEAVVVKQAVVFQQVVVLLHAAIKGVKVVQEAIVIKQVVVPRVGWVPYLRKSSRQLRDTIWVVQGGVIHQILTTYGSLLLARPDYEPEGYLMNT
jgi:hypothetical protein